jgi:hypothetical protein
VTTVITIYDLHEGAQAPTALAAEHTLYRAAGVPASFAWIDLGEAPTPEAAAQLVVEAGQRPGALSGRYDAFHVNEQPAEPFDPSGRGESVIFVNCMRFAPEHHDAALAAWEQVNQYMVGKPGYRWHRLHRRLDDSAPFGLVNVVGWESPEAWQAAHDEGFRALVGGDLPFTAFPTLCRPERARPGRGERRSAPALESVAQGVSR